MIVMNDVSFTYPNTVKPVIHDLNLNVSPGECVVLTGRSGCGKTTVTRLINGLACHFFDGRFSGTITLNGQNIEAIPFWKIGRHVGSVLQDPSSQFFAEKVTDEIAFGCENYGMPAGQMKQRIVTAAEKTGTAPLTGQSLFRLSSGQQQRVAIASIYAVNPELYVFDEPSANLDETAVRRLEDLMRVLKNEGKTLIVAEHRLHYLTHLADRFLYMDNGRVTASYSGETILEMDPQTTVRLGLRSGRVPQLKRCPRNDVSVTGPELVIENLCFSYQKKQVLNHFSFSAGPGEIVAITGKNGAGKTTLARIISGLLKERSGRLLFKGRPVRHRARRKHVFFVMQHADSQLFAESVGAEIRLNAKGNPDVDQLLSRYQLSDWKNVHPSMLSGGQKQRLTLAVAEAADPDLLLLDEPTSGLDGGTMRLVARSLQDMAARGVTIIVITHDTEFIASACTRLVRIGHGHVILDEGIEN
jgi:ATPase components of various ABC-type transport systems, contain duplicated ATPase